MPKDKLEPVATGWPVAEAQREELRHLVRGPLPAVLADSIKLPCQQCQMELWIGPFTQIALKSVPGCIVLCPVCLFSRQNVESFTTVNLGNPASHFEGDN